MSAALLVMAKAPEPGRTKTRLQPYLGASGCARLQAALTRRTAELAARVAPRAAFLAYTPAYACDQLRRLVPDDVELFAQHGADLGERLAAATAYVAAHRPGPVVVVGTDLPVLGPGHVAAALDQLAGGCEVSYGPAYDGGYYLVAMAEVTPLLFRLPAGEWGGPRILELSMAAAEAAGLAVGLLEPERDVDTRADAAALTADPRLPAEIGRLLAPALPGGPGGREEPA